MSPQISRLLITNENSGWCWATAKDTTVQYPGYECHVTHQVKDSSYSQNFLQEERKDVKIYLEMFLQLELSKAKSLKEWPTVARISEVLRCVRVLDSVGCHKLFEILKDDYCQRFVYMQYLLQSKQTLLSMEANLKS